MSLLIVSVVREIGGCRLGGREAGFVKVTLEPGLGSLWWSQGTWALLALESEF